MRTLMHITHLAFLLSFMAVTSAYAPALQADIEIEHLEVSLWPEYDRPAVLVIYQARLGQAVDLPATITLPIPADVGDPHAVAIRDSDGGLIDATYHREVDGDWASVQVEARGREIWVEYYDKLTYESGVRRYSFTWPGGIALGSLTYEVLQPLFAEGMDVSPAGQAAEAADGRTYIREDLGPQPRTALVEVNLEYHSEVSTRAGSPPPSMSGQNFEQLEVAFWPEYDRPGVLVFYRVQLPQDAPLPIRVELPIPADVGEPHAVATRNTQGALLDAEYHREVQGDWAVITMEADNRDLWLEFYDDLVVEGQERLYAFQWPHGASIGSFGFEIQQPLGAERMLTSPAGTTQSGQDGFVYYVGSGGLRSGDAALLVAFQYAKTTPQLSVEAEPAQPGLTRPQATSGGTPGLGEMLPWFLGALGAVVLLGGTLYYVRLTRTSAEKPRTRRRRRSPRGREGQEIDASPIYCHVCGTQAGVSDRYCRRCGTQLR